MEKYKQMTNKYKTKKGLLTIVDTFELIDGKYYIEDTYIVLNGAQLVVPDYWKSYSQTNLLKKISTIINEKIEDLLYLGEEK